MFAFYQVLFGQKMHNSTPATGHFTDPLTFPKILYTLKKSRVQTSVKPGQIIQNFNGRFYKKNMVQNPYQNALLPAPVGGGYSDPDYWIWCGSVVQGEDGAYHMFASRWPKDLGFGANWLFNCEIVRASSKIRKVPIPFRRSCSDAGDALF